MQEVKTFGLRIPGYRAVEIHVDLGGRAKNI